MSVMIARLSPFVYVLLAAPCLTPIASAQMSWWRVYGGESGNEGRSVQQTSDRGYVIAGWTAGQPPVYLIKADSSGDTMWTRTYGGERDIGESVRQTSDGGYVVVGLTFSFGPGAPDTSNVYLIKTDVHGDTIWTKTYGGAGFDVGYAVQQTADGGYVLAGYSDSSARHVFNLIKTDAYGDALWTKAYERDGTSEGVGHSVEQTSDGGYIAAGTAKADVYLVRTNEQGDTLWTRVYGGQDYEEGYAVQQTDDGGYVVVGCTHSYGAGHYDVYLIKIGATGDLMWTRTYGGTGDDIGRSVLQTSDGGYFIAGWTDSYGVGSHDSYLIKTDASGDTLWTRTYGGTYVEEGYSAQQTTDGGYVVAGLTYSFGVGCPHVYLIKTDSLGGVGVEEPADRQPVEPSLPLVHPNPFTSFARVPGRETEFFVLLDVTGRQVAICRGDRIGEGLRPGVYFLSPVGAGAARTATTIVKATF